MGEVPYTRSNNTIDPKMNETGSWGKRHTSDQLT